MKLAKELIKKLESQLNNWLGSKILDYKIIVQIDAILELRLLVPTEFNEAELFEITDFKGYENVILISQVTQSEYEADKFKDNEKRDYYNHRRRLSRLIKPNNNIFSDEEKKSIPPIITFYSYKGGLGRTTALACFAAYMARIKGKKVVVVDCDFEAPGFSSGNYFFTEENNKCGVVEYLLDKEFNAHMGINPNSKDFDLKDYAYTDIDESFTSYTDKETKQKTQGELYIIPAGNTQDQEIYLESLARIDLGYDLKGFIEDIQNRFELTPENGLILFDSRTGFNDTFAALSEVSSVLVGIFGVNQQNKAGIKFFVDHFYQNGKKNFKKVFFVKGLGNYKEVSTLNSIVEGIVNEREEEEKINFGYKVSYVETNEVLKDLGSVSIKSQDKTIVETFNVTKEDFIDFLDGIIHSNRANLNDLFTEIWDFAEPQKKKMVSAEIEIDNIKVEIPIISSDISLENKLFEGRNNLSIEQVKAIKIEFLRNIQFPELSAESYESIERIEQEFLFRSCMQDIFNKSKFIILGSKGAGKTFLYNILNDGFSDVTLDKLCRLASKNRNNFIFINAINANEPVIISNIYNNISQFTKQTYDAYWKMLSCYAVFSNPKIQAQFPFKADFNEWIKEIINTNLEIDLIRLDANLTLLRQIEGFLKTNNKKMILSFDKLDRVIPLSNWKTAISSLIDFWRNNPDFNHILPKIFIRADFFNNEQIEANNIETLKKYSVLDIAWKKEELFAHFFKIVLQSPIQRERFYQYLVSYHNRENNEVFEDITSFIIAMENSIHKFGQLPLIEDDFRKLVIVVFDRTADYNEENSGYYPSSYDWFFNNIQDGLEQTNLRSFWKLIELAINNTKLSELSRNPIEYFPLISPKFYTEKQHRESAAKVFYDELKAEVGNESLKDFHKFFNDDSIKIDRKYNYFESEFKSVIHSFIDANPLTEIVGIINNTSRDKQVEGVIHWLVNNGIVKEVLTNQGRYTKYIFPYFYRSLFNLRS